MENAKKFGLNAVAISGSTKDMERSKIWNDLKENKIDMLFATPELFTNSTAIPDNMIQFSHTYKSNKDDAWTKIALLVIDEIQYTDYWEREQLFYLHGFERLIIEFTWAKEALKLCASTTVSPYMQMNLDEFYWNSFTEVRGDLFLSNLAIRIIPTNYNDIDARIKWLKEFCNKVGFYLCQEG